MMGGGAENWPGPAHDGCHEPPAKPRRRQLGSRYRQATRFTQGDESAAARLAAIVESSEDAIISATPEGVIQTWNVSAERVFGYSAAEAVGQHLATLMPPDLPTELGWMLDCVRRGNAIRHYEAGRLRKDGSRIEVSLSASPIKDAAGRIVGVSWIARDITQHKRVERDRELLLESTDQGIFAVDLHDRCIFINSAAAAMLGLQPEEVIGKTPHTLFHHTRPDGTPYGEEECPLFRAIRAGEGVRTANEILWRPDGTSFPVEYSSHPIRENGAIKGAVVTFHDISERKQAEAERAALLAREQTSRKDAERQAAQMHALLESMTAGVVILDAAGRAVQMNPVARDILHLPEKRGDWTPDDYRVLDLRRPDGSPLPFADWPINRALREERFSEVEVILVRPDGSQRWLAFTGSAVRGSEGAVTLAICVFRDVTRLHELEQAREDYIHTISHDLRAPLTIVLGQSQSLERLLGRTSLPARAQTSLNAIATSAKRMNAMIQDLVDSARLEGGQLKVQPAPLDLRSFILQLKDRLAGAMEAERITLHSPERLPLVEADADRLERILMNLLSNALKYSAPGTEVEVTLVPGDSQVTTSVIDRGPGIAPEQLPRLFQRFYRASAARERREGLGLGLYITRALVEAHGGRIWAESVVGQGSKFFFTLPLAPSHGQNERSTTA